MKSMHASVLLAACQPFIWIPAFAQNKLTIPMEIARVSNPDLSVVSRGSVNIYRFHPQYTLQAIEGTARTELTLGALIERSDNIDLSANRTLPSVSLLWEDTSPVDLYGFRASFEKASTRDTEFAEFGRVTRDSTQRTGTLGGNWNRKLNAASSIDWAASHVRVSYDVPQLVNYNETRGSVVYQIELSSKSKYSLSAGVSRLVPEMGLESATRRELGLGYQTDLREGVTLNAKAGAVRTSGPRSDSNFVGALSVEYKGEKAGYSLGWARDINVDSSTARYTRSESLEGSFKYPFTENTSLSLGFSQAKSLEADRNKGGIVYARVRSELTRLWALTIGLENRHAKVSRGPTASGNSLVVGLVYSHPDF
jgi:hypothetical protein